MLADGGLYLQIPRTFGGQDEAAARGWMEYFAFEALNRALTEAGDAFRKSITPDEARRQNGERIRPKKRSSRNAGGRPSSSRKTNTPESTSPGSNVRELRRPPEGA